METPNTEQLTKILDKFLSKDEVYKYNLQKPFIIDDYVYGTNGHVIIRFEKKHYNQEVVNDEIPSVEYVKSIFNPDTEILNLRLDVQKIEALNITQYKSVDNYDFIEEECDCNECDGTGEVEWEYSSYSKLDECPVCDGSGTIEETKEVLNSEKIYPLHTYIKIEDTYLNPVYFEYIMDIQNITKEDIIIPNKPVHNKCLLFKVGIFEIGIMPIVYSYGYGEKNDDEIIIDLLK